MELTSQWITTHQQLQQACQRWQKLKAIAIDTEFVRYNTFYPQPGLIQVSDGLRHYLVDPLTIDQWQPWTALLQQQSVIKVLHASREDIELCRHLFGVWLEPVFDSQLAGALLGFGLQQSYQQLVKEQLGIHLTKSETRSNWRQRPLTQAQQRYAVLDVAYLLPLYEGLQSALGQQDRLAWLKEETHRLLNRIKRHYQEDGQQAYQRVKGAWQLSAEQLAQLKPLACWREQQAKQQNQPKQWLIKDAALIWLVQQQPKEISQLANCSYLSAWQIKNYGEYWLHQLTSPQQPISVPLAAPFSQDAKPLLKQLQGCSSQQARQLAITADLLAPRKALEELISTGWPQGNYQLTDFFQGWRQSVIGNKLLAICQHW
jgi:ribonuclease D